MGGREVTGWGGVGRRGGSGKLREGLAGACHGFERGVYVDKWDQEEWGVRCFMSVRHLPWILGEGFVWISGGGGTEAGRGERAEGAGPKGDPYGYRTIRMDRVQGFCLDSPATGGWRDGAG